MLTDVNLAICATPRSASNQLCSALSHVGFGLPREFMHYSQMERQSTDFKVHFDPNRSEDYFSDLRKHFTRNGVFAVKVFHYEHLRVYPDLLRTFEGGHFVHLERQDIVSQVVSLAALMKTGRPLDSDVQVRKEASIIDVKLLRHIEMLIVTSNKFWRRFLVGKRALHIYTENLIRDPETVGRDIFDFCGRRDFSAEAFRDYVFSQSKYSIDTDVKVKIRADFKETLAQIKERHERRMAKN